MTTEKKICCGIMLCQMTAILSMVALVYLSSIVVGPSLNELSLEFNIDPIMCTTMKTEDKAVKKDVQQKTPLKCDNPTCVEWCLSNSAAPCIVVDVLARKNGSAVTFSTCYDVDQRTCSALDVNLTHSYRCKKGECKELTGTFTCTKDGDNECREISPAYDCGPDLNETPTKCDEEKCEKRLEGVYGCIEGVCNKVHKVKYYWRDCERKCIDLKLSDVNVVIFNKNGLVSTKCSTAHSTNNSISELNEMDDWKAVKKVLFVFCTYFIKTKGIIAAYDLHTGDCFNATLGDQDRIENITNYLDLVKYVKELHNQSDWLIEPEESLGVMNITQLRINPDGCVNTLKQECKQFFKTHSTDGRDGRTQDRYPCYISDKITDYVISKFDPQLTFAYLLISTALPGTLFVFSCFCLFVCSKSIGVDEEGHLKVTLFQGNTSGVDKNPVQFDALL